MIIVNNYAEEEIKAGGCWATVTPIFPKSVARDFALRSGQFFGEEPAVGVKTGVP
jgi:hypothetical protein